MRHGGGPLLLPRCTRDALLVTNPHMRTIPLEDAATLLGTILYHALRFRIMPLDKPRGQVRGTRAGAYDVQGCTSACEDAHVHVMMHMRMRHACVGFSCGARSIRQRHRASNGRGICACTCRLQLWSQEYSAAPSSKQWTRVAQPR